jgi:hypothetical protein
MNKNPILCFVAAVLLVACKKEAPWSPGTAYPTSGSPVYRGYLDLRGLIHFHNVHSWDACDKTPLINGQLNTDCYQQFRGDFCEAQIDFLFMSDHGSNFVTTEFPGSEPPGSMEMDNTLLYTPSMGDQLLTRNGAPVANKAFCSDKRQHLIVAGDEGNNLMSVGLESHVAPADATGAAREAIYGISTNETTFPANVPAITSAIQTIQSHGAVVFISHPEDVTEQMLATYPIDGFEMYNLHANALFTEYGSTHLLELITNLSPGGDPDQVPTNPNTVFLDIFSEDPNYMTRWAYVASQGQRRTMILGSDAHQNAIPEIMSDGERGDRYRRVMEWFSNHALVTPNQDGSWDDTNVKASLKAGRVYGVFEALGYPVGFDYHATAGSQVIEMGGQIALTSAPVLSVKLPEIQNFNNARQSPAFTARILRADGENWDEVASGSTSLTFTPTQSGAYRAEIREVPYHLREDVGPVANQYLLHDYVWIYSNSIYVQ